MSVAGLMLASCSSEEISAPQTDGTEMNEQLQVSISMNSLARVTDAAYETGDNVGLYIVNYNEDAPGALQASGNHADNAKFTKAVSEWTPATPIYWKDKTTKADFYCYYPYAAGMSTTAYSFAVKEDQSSEANYKASEFLWGKATGVAPTKEAVNITTDRLMSNIIVKLVRGKGFTEEAWAATTICVKVCSTKPAATINLSTGVAIATGAAKEITPLKVSEGYRAMIVPQTITADQPLLNITVNGDTYAYKKAFTFVANKRHHFSITINKIKDGIDIGIGGWGDDGTDHGGTAE